MIRSHGLAARKTLGQNFLLDLNLTRRIARAAGPIADCDVVEIGPGPGGLTRALLLEGARRVVAIERDARCIAALEDLAAAFPGRLEIVAGDALALDPAEMSRSPRKIVANLPYNIATPLLIGWLWQIGRYERLTLMFQKEVALRLGAVPGTKNYGRLSVLAQFVAEVTPAFDVAASAFVPPPKVTSRVMTFVPLAVPRGACRLADLERVTAAAFGQRRKMLRQSLKTLGDAETLLAATGIDPTARAETLPVEAFAALAAAMGRRAGG